MGWSADVDLCFSLQLNIWYKVRQQKCLAQESFYSIFFFLSLYAELLPSWPLLSPVMMGILQAGG